VAETPFFPAWAALEAAVEQHRAGIDQHPALPTTTTEEIREHLSTNYKFGIPVDAKHLIEDVASLLRDGMVHTTHARYFGLFNPDIQPIAVAADAIVAAFNPQLAAYSHAPGPNEIERHTLDLFRRALALPEGGSATFTSGGSEANHSALIAALTAKVSDYAETGASGRPTMYASAEAHHSLVKMAHACGIGRRAVRVVPVDANLAMDPAAFRRIVTDDRAAGASPFMVVGTAGTTSAGAIDPLPAIAGIAAEEGLWFHVDAAWGGAACLSSRLRPLLDGIERADSVTIDAHKWLSVPMGCGMFFCRDAAHTSAAFGIQTAYMPSPVEAPDPYLNTLQWSRRHIGLKLFMTLAALGLGEVTARIEHMADVADRLAFGLRAAGWRVVHHSPLAVVTFTHPEVVDLDSVLQHVYREGGAWISKTVLTGHGAALRACVTNHRTSAADADALVEILERAVDQVPRTELIEPTPLAD